MTVSYRNELHGLDSNGDPVGRVTNHPAWSDAEEDTWSDAEEPAVDLSGTEATADDDSDGM